MKLVFLGPPGAGKGTQALRVSEKMGLPHYSTGDLLRSEASRGTELGVRARTYMDRGDLVPDELVIEMVAARLASPEAAHGYVLDGFPRTVAQAEELEKRAGKDAIDRAIYFDVDEELVVERLGGRMTCRECGRMYHSKTVVPRAEGVCDACGGSLHSRPDDRPETVRERLRVYLEKSEPLAHFYEKKGVLVRIDASRAPSEVNQELLRVLKERE